MNILQDWTVIFVALAYIAVLFALAYWGEKRPELDRHPVLRPLIYALSLAVYCTSWTFFGAVGTATAGGWEYLAIYLGPILLFIFGHSFLQKLVQTGKNQHSSSIADFIAARYGKSQKLAALVTVIAVMGSLPYIALQLKAVAMSFHVLTAANESHFLKGLSTSANDTAFIVALTLALFSILFGTRHLDATEHHRGLILAVAFESIVKLVALTAVGLFVIFGIFKGFGGLSTALEQLNAERQLFSRNQFNMEFFTLMFLSMGAIFCLPRQFHVAVVECNNPGDMRHARWLFPLYLILISLVIIPITIGGLAALESGQHNPDSFVLELPLQYGAEWLAVLVFIGGFSAATGMVIIATLTLSTMISNDIVMPILLRIRGLKLDQRQDLSGILLLVRRATILLLMMLAYWYFMGGSERALARIGVLSFAAAVQFVPAVIGGLYWSRGHRRGVVYGLTIGFLVWLYTLLLPSLDTGIAPLMADPTGNAFSVSWLNPDGLFGTIQVNDLTLGVFWSLLTNTLFYIIFSLSARPQIIDRVQASRYVSSASSVTEKAEQLPKNITAKVADLRLLCEKFIGVQGTRKAFQLYEQETGHNLRERAPVTPALISYTESQLAKILGAAVAHRILYSALAGSDIHIEDVVSLLDETSQELQFRGELLHVTLENISQGISVVDKDMRLVAWNRHYLELFEFPEGFIHEGKNIEDIIRYNAERGECGPGEVEEQVRIRLSHLQGGKAHNYIRYRPNGRVLQNHGNPMPGGGYVTSFTDITELKRIEEALREREQSIRFYMDNVPALITYVGRDERLLFANKAFERTWNPRGGSLVGKTIREVVGEKEYALREPHIHGALDGRKQTFDIELHQSGADLRFAQVIYVPQIDSNGHVLGFFSLYQDITARRKAETALQEAYETLEARVKERTQALSILNKDMQREIMEKEALADALRDAVKKTEDATESKTRFLAAASHDLLQPLNAARLFASSLEEDLHQSNAPHAETARNIISSLQAAEKLLRALLDISKLDAGALTPNVTDFNIAELLDPLAIEFTALASDKGLGFRHVPSTAIIRSDRGLLMSVLQNLLSNALRYTQNGKILIGCRCAGDRLHVDVIDTGIGIPANKQKEIFKEFHRLNGHDTTEDRGIGLGLAITERIINMLGHHISVYSTPGQGSRFRVTLPLVGRRRHEPSSHSTPNWKVGNKLAGMTVLCIDNEPSILDAMRDLLHRWQCHVLTAHDMVEATQATTDPNVIDLILADYHLNDGVTGLDVMRELRRSAKQPIPGILITADQSEKVAEQAALEGYQILHKPVEAAALRALMSQIARQQ